MASHGTSRANNCRRSTATSIALTNREPALPPRGHMSATCRECLPRQWPKRRSISRASPSHRPHSGRRDVCIPHPPCHCWTSGGWTRRRRSSSPRIPARLDTKGNLRKCSRHRCPKWRRLRDGTRLRARDDSSVETNWSPRRVAFHGPCMTSQAGPRSGANSQQRRGRLATLRPPSSDGANDDLQPAFVPHRPTRRAPAGMFQTERNTTLVLPDLLSSKA